MVPEEDDLMKSQNVPAVLNIVHLDLDARPAPAGRGRIDISDHRAGIDPDGPDKVDLELDNRKSGLFRQCRMDRRPHSV